MLIRLALILVLTASCTTTPAPALTSVPSAPSTLSGQPKPFEAPRWVKLPPTGVIATGVLQTVAGWDGGLLLVTDTANEFGVFTSKDGHAWRAAAPKGMIGLAAGLGRMVAGYGAAGYLLGWTSRGPTVWRTEDGGRWETIPLKLSNLKLESRVDLKLTITAGPRGVMVVGSDNYVPPRYHGVYVWHSPDGRSFNPMTQVPSRIDKVPPIAVAEATPNGFLMAMSDSNGQMLLSSENGVRWQDITAGLAQIRGIAHVSGNVSTVVVFTYDPLPGASPGEPLAWYRRDGTWHAATMDPGRLPDAGVVPADERRVNKVGNWGTGFIALGNTLGGDGRETAGLVWYSADGSAWTRMPVRDNGFDTAAQLMDIAVSRGKAVLVGYPASNSKKPLIWKADVP
ncbi:hypothetical protein AB0G05_42900 [Nonomuraea wenchangensis]